MRLLTAHPILLEVAVAAIRLRSNHEMALGLNIEGIEA
jgi:hypothetical protein